MDARYTVPTPLSDIVKPYCILSLEQFITCIKADKFWNKTFTDEVIFEYCKQKNIPLIPPSDYNKKQFEAGPTPLLESLEAQLNFENACAVKREITKKILESNHSDSIQTQRNVLATVYSYYLNQAKSKHNLNAIYHYFMEKITDNFENACNIKSCLDGLLNIEIDLSDYVEHSYGVCHLMIARIYLLLAKELNRFLQINSQTNTHGHYNPCLFPPIENDRNNIHERIQHYLTSTQIATAKLQEDLKYMLPCMTQGVFYSQLANGCVNWDEIVKDLNNTIKFENFCITPPRPN